MLNTTHLCRSFTSKTFPKVPSPSVDTTSSEISNIRQSVPFLCCFHIPLPKHAPKNTFLRWLLQFRQYMSCMQFFFHLKTCTVQSAVVNMSMFQHWRCRWSRINSLNNFLKLPGKSTTDDRLGFLSTGKCKMTNNLLKCRSDYKLYWKVSSFASFMKYTSRVTPRKRQRADTIF